MFHWLTGRRLCLSALVVVATVLGWAGYTTFNAIQTALDAERTLHAHTAVIYALEEFVSQQEHWPESWDELATVRPQHQGMYRWPEDMAAVRERITLDRDVTLAEVVAMSPTEFVAVRQRDPNFGPREEEVIWLKESIRRVLSQAASGADDSAVGAAPPEGETVGAERPIVALWQQYDGRAGTSPCLRFAVWADGRVVYAADPSQWGQDLRKGRISAGRVARLQTELADTGVFDLRGTCYLVPDAATDCLMIDLHDKRQMLYWDEVETPRYGINSNPKPHHRDFIRCWKAVNHLVLLALPKDGEVVKDRFRVPQTWYLERPVQSD